MEHSKRAVKEDTREVLQAKKNFTNEQNNYNVFKLKAYNTK